MPGNGQQQSKRWTWTLNNWTEDEKAVIDNLVEEGLATYVCYGKEVGEAGTPHLQGYIELPRKLRLGGVKQLLSGRAHLQRSRGNAAENRAYCSKDGDFHEFGEAANQGARSDLAAVKASIDNGADCLELWETHFGAMVRYEKSFQRYAALKRSRSPSQPVEILVLWGPTGTGKSRFPRLIDPDLFSLPDVTLQWFDGYDGQEVVLFDDFDGKDCPVAKFLRYFDRYDVQVPVKGGFVPFIPKRIWISSNSSPDDWFPNELQAKRDAVRRRLTRVIQLHGPIDFDDREDIEHIKTLLNLQ